MAARATDCLDDNTLAQWLQGLLSGEGAERVEAHLDECAECRTLVSALSSSSHTTNTVEDLVAGATVPMTPPGASGSSPDIRPGMVIAGKYRIEGIVGTGGMGVVAAAMHLTLRQRVALKFIKQSVLGDAHAVVRFVREAQAAVRLSGEHVARVLDLGTVEDGAPYIVMEYLEGDDLGSHLQSTGPLPVERAIDFLLEACEGIAEAHAAGLVHRDLKPANLFLARRPNGDTVLKVVDFGISKFIGATTESDLALTDASVAMGSPLYSAPEQLVSARDVDERADIWALGIILYQMLSGRVPFEGSALPQVVAKVLHAEVPPLSELRPDVPAPILRVLERCLEREPAKRFANVGELVAAVSPFASTATSQTTPAPVPVRGRRWWPAAAAGVLVAAATLIAVTVLTRSSDDTRAGTSPDAGSGSPVAPHAGAPSVDAGSGIARSVDADTAPAGPTHAALVDAPDAGLARAKTRRTPKPRSHERRGSDRADEKPAIDAAPREIGENDLLDPS